MTWRRADTLQPLFVLRTEAWLLWAVRLCQGKEKAAAICVVTRQCGREREGVRTQGPIPGGTFAGSGAVRGPEPEGRRKGRVGLRTQETRLGGDLPQTHR